jgi:putative transposase
MSRAYKFRDQSLPYFVSFATVNWIDLFTRRELCEIVIDSIKYCQKEKGLIVYAWCIMPSHVHMIIGTSNKPMQDIMRDFKSYTSKKLREEIKELPIESRKEWLLWMFERAGRKNGNNNDWQLWQQHNQPIELATNIMLEQRLDYLHNNPVVAGYVDNAREWRWSSARDYEGEKGVLDVYLVC